MKTMNKELEKKSIKEKVSIKLGQTFINIAESSTKSCIILGIYEPKISIELIKSLMK